MLIEFSVENFLSIKDKITLSMLASSGKENPDNLIESPYLKKDKLLKSAVIYGANASGKTNILRALKFVRDLVKSSHEYQPEKRIPVIPFKLDQNYLEKPSNFSLTFMQKNIKYSYNISLTREKIIDESLYYWPNGVKSTIFERTDTNNYKFTIDKQEQEVLSGRTSENKLYLTVAAQWNFDKILSAFGEIIHIFPLIDEDSLMDYSKSKAHLDTEFRRKLFSYLQKADLGIIAMTTEISGWGKTEFLDNESIKKANVKVNTYHNGIGSDGNKIIVEFDFEEESQGTQRFFELAGLFIYSLETGSICIIDELESSIHPNFTKTIVELFHNPDINKNNAQLIFTTHDTNLLNLDIFRRDQIWFTEKDPEKGSTQLYSLDEYSPRKDENIQKGYLQGRYGSIPFLGDWSTECQ